MKIGRLKGFLFILSGQIGTVLLTVLTIPLLVRLLGSSQYGDYAFIMSLLGVLMILINAGIFDGIRKFVAENRSNIDWENNVFAYYMRLGFFLSLFSFLLLNLLILLGVTTIFLDSGFNSYLIIMSFIIIFRQAYYILRGALMGKGLENITEPVQVLRKLSFGVIGLILVYLGYGVNGALLGHLISFILFCIVMIIFVRSEYDLTYIFRKSSPKFSKKELRSFNTSSIVLIFLIYSLYHVDILLLQPMVGSESTGYYRAALQITEFLWLVPIALQTALLHSTSKIWSERDPQYITDISSLITRYTIALTVLLVIGVAALVDPFVPLYFGEEFRPAIGPLLILLPGTLGFAISRPIFSIGQGKGALRPLIIATGLAAIINFGLNLALIPAYGMYGAAIATSIGYASMLFFHGISARQIGYNPFADLRLSSILLAALSTSLIIFPLSRLLDSMILPLLVIPPVGLVVYTLVAIKTGAIEQEHLDQILDRFPPSFETVFKTIL